MAGPTIDRERAPQVGSHAAWAMAVGGMVGGGAYTLAGVILGAAGAWAWLSLLLGAAVALVTVGSYERLTLSTGATTVPVALFARAGKRRRARALAWALLAVYILALAIYVLALLVDFELASDLF